MKEVLDFRFSGRGEKRMKDHEAVDFNHRAHQLIKDKVNTSSFGLCCTCDYFHYQRTTHKTIKSWCSYWMDMAGVSYPAMVPNTVDPIINCTTYKDKHSMDIHEMKMLAWHIDIIKKPRIATGFQMGKKEDNGVEETEIIIEKPESRGNED